MSMHSSTFEYLKPTDEQIAQMATVRDLAARVYSEILERTLTDANPTRAGHPDARPSDGIGRTRRIRSIGTPA
jgi:hypothetical protein